MGDVWGIGGVGEAVKSIFDDIGKAIPDATQRQNIQGVLDEKKQELLEKIQDSADLQVKAETDIEQAQVELDKIQAQNNDKFIAYARPAAMWVGVLGLLYASLFYPLMLWFNAIFKWQAAPPTLDTNITMQVLFGLLGLGAYRTVEK